MASFREIVTKAVIGKGKKQFTDNLSLQAENTPTTVLGCWVINHTFSGEKINNIVNITGSYDINVWYSYDNDTKTEVLKQRHSYNEVVTIQGNNQSNNNEEIIIRSLSGPSCVKAEINGNNILTTIEKTLGIELVGDTKVRINVEDNYSDDWDEITDSDETINKQIDEEVVEDYITDKDEVYLKHFYDSIAPILQGLIENQPIRLLDIGAGAGFPSLPMKILFPDLDVTIIDSLNKRINFLHLLAEELGLSGVHFYHGRAEDFAQDKAFRAQFDIVTARAVARMQVLSELTIPYLKVGGRLLALKASNAPEELEEAKNALNLLFSKVEDNLQYELPNGDPRYITVVEKKKETPNKYPRKAGMPNKRPL